MWQFLIFFCALFSFCGCGLTTFADLRCEGEAQTKKLVKELRSIETKEELQKKLPSLRKRFNQIAELLIEAQKVPYQECEPSAASEELFIELARLYEMPGGRELIETAQSQAVLRLYTNHEK